MKIDHQIYLVSFFGVFSAARMLEERIEGHDFQVTLILQSSELFDGCVVPRAHIKGLIDEFNGVNLNQLLSPAEPTTENLTRAVQQKILDYLFRMELDDKVQIVSIQVTERPGEYVEIKSFYTAD